MASKRGLVAREHESLAAIDARPQRPRLTEIWVVWALYGLATVAVFETYWRIPPQELWKVHNSGFVGGAGRALVFVGFHLDGVPFFGWVFQTGKAAPEPGSGHLHATVHYGHHHGLDGLLLVVTALLLSRLLGGIRRPPLRVLTGVVLALMLVYGWTNMVNDLWIEQVVKRGWTSWQVPDVLFPSFSLAWAAMLVAAAAIYAAFFARRPLLRR